MPQSSTFCEGVHDDVHDDGSAHLKLSTIKIKADDDDEGEYDDDDDDDNDDDDDCDDDYREEASTLLQRAVRCFSGEKMAKYLNIRSSFYYLMNIELNLFKYLNIVK